MPDLTAGIEQIRDFCIIAHIDHGKSTLADRLLEYTETVCGRQLRDQVLDSMDLERERGITIKAQAVRMNYQASDAQEYVLNLIDTPGHVDFSYEVSRSLAACDGALLVVDALQGVEAQTLANTYLALDRRLNIIPIINKIDLPDARPDEVRAQIEEIVGLDGSEVVFASARTGEGTRDVLEAIVARIPHPLGRADKPLKALIFDSLYNPFRGAIIYARVFDGTIEPGMRIRMMSRGKTFEVSEVGVFRPDATVAPRLSVGDVGYVIANIKSVREVQVGDTITDVDRPAGEPMRGCQTMQPMVFCGLYPADSGNFEGLRDALQKLSLNDSSFVYEPETSQSLGFGFRCGFLGLLHMEIVQERLEREFRLELITTAPSVMFRVRTKGGRMLDIENPSLLPPSDEIDGLQEPYVLASIITPSEHVGAVYELCEGRRGNHESVRYFQDGRAIIVYRLPLAEIVADFYDRLKSTTKGYGSLDYDHLGHFDSDLVKLDVLLNGSPVDALSCIVHRDRAHAQARQLTEKLKKLIPRQLFQVMIQAAIGGRIIARETIKPLRKNVTAKCYGGDITRKRKLLEKQKEGKRRMKQVGKVEVPQEAFMALFQTD